MQRNEIIDELITSVGKGFGSFLLSYSNDEKAVLSDSCRQTRVVTVTGDDAESVNIATME